MTGNPTVEPTAVGYGTWTDPLTGQDRPLLRLVLPDVTLDVVMTSELRWALVEGLADREELLEHLVDVHGTDRLLADGGILDDLLLIHRLQHSPQDAVDDEPHRHVWCVISKTAAVPKLLRASCGCGLIVTAWSVWRVIDRPAAEQFMDPVGLQRGFMEATGGDSQ